MFENGRSFFSNVPAQLETVTWSSFKLWENNWGSGADWAYKKDQQEELNNRKAIEKPGYFASFKPCQLPCWKPTERLHLWGVWLRSSAHRMSQSSATMLRWSCWSTECCIKQLHGVDGAGWEDGNHILWERLGADVRFWTCTTSSFWTCSFKSGYNT